MGTRTCIGAVVALALVLCASATASAARPKLRVDARTAVPGQVLVLTLPGSARHATVKIGGKRAKVLSRRKRTLQVRVPALKPGRVMIAVGRLRAPLRIVKPFRGAVRPAADASHAGSGTIGRDGGTVTAHGADGTAYALSIPAGALDTATPITVTPLSRLAGLPVDAGRAPAVQFGPDGLVLG